MYEIYSSKSKLFLTFWLRYHVGFLIKMLAYWGELLAIIITGFSYWSDCKAATHWWHDWNCWPDWF